MLPFLLKDRETASHSTGGFSQFDLNIANNCYVCHPGKFNTWKRPPHGGN